MDESWRDALGAEFSKPYMRKLQEFLSTEWQQHSIYPPQPLIFRWVTCHAQYHPRLRLHFSYFHSGMQRWACLCFLLGRMSTPSPEDGSV